jgi:hypothetical protein
MPPIRNPYLNRSMIRSVGEFYGRQRETRRVLSRIGAPTPQSVSIVGERRMGKSSLLWHLAQPEVHGTAFDEPERCLFIVLDFQGHQHLDQSGCCSLLARRVVELAGDRLDPVVPAEDGLNELLDVAAALDAAGMRLVCLFDEFETVTRNAAIGPEFYGALRSLANASAVAFVTASRRPLQDLCHNQEISESPFFNIFTEVVVGPMTDAEVHELIAVPSEAAGVPLAIHEGIIRDLSGNLPFFVQIAASAMVECLADGREPTPKQLESAFLEEATSHFRYFVDAFSDEERAVLRALARGEPVAGEVADHLEDQGFLCRRDDMVVPFSTALLRFTEQEEEFAETDVQAASPPPQASGGNRKRAIVLLGAAVLTAAIALAAVLSWPSDPGGGLQVTTLSPARVAALGLAVEVQMQSPGSPQHHVVSVNEGSPNADGNVPINDGDLLRLALTVREESLVYVFVIPPAGEVERMPEDASRPIRVEPGKIVLLPSGDGWLRLRAAPDEDGPWDVVVVAGDTRQGDLEDQLMRHRQATGAQRDSLSQSLMAEIRSRGAVGIRFSVARGQT